MEQESPLFARMERTLWTVWGYITEAVNRILRPQPADTINSTPNSLDESRGDSEPPDCDLTQDDTTPSSGGDNEEQRLPTASLLSSSSLTVQWKVCMEDVKSEEDTKLRGNENNEPEHSKCSRDEDQTGSDQAGLLGTKEEATNQFEQGKIETEKFYTCERAEAPENEEEPANAATRNLTDEFTRRMEKSDEEVGAEEESVSTVTVGVDQKVDEMKILEMDDDEQEDLEEEGGMGKLCTITDEEDSMINGKEGQQEDNVSAMLTMGDANISKGALQQSSGTKEIETQLSVCEELSKHESAAATQELRGENDQFGGERVQAAATEEEEEEAANKQTQDEDQDQTSRTIKDGHQGANVTQFDTCSEEAVQNTWQDTTEFTHEEKDVVTTIKQTTETNVTVAEVDLDKSLVGKDLMREERPSGEDNNKENCVEMVCLTTSVTVKPEGESAREINREFKNIPQVTTEGQGAALHKRNTGDCEETREGVPERNNELESDENKTQSFLEGGNCGEIHITQLPEEVENKEWASLKNNGTGAGYLMGKELLEEKQNLQVQESTGNQHFALETEKQQAEGASLESEAEEAELPDNSMKTEIKPSNKEFETYAGSADETDKTNKELQDGAEAAEFGVDRELVDVKVPVGDGCVKKTDVKAKKWLEFTDETSNFLEVEKMAETNFCQESVQPAYESQENNRISSLSEEITDGDVLQQIESKLSDDSAAELEHVGLDNEEKDYTDEEEEGELAKTTAERKKGQKDKETALIVEPELSLHPETQNMIKQTRLRTVQMDETDTVTDSQTPVESKTMELKDLEMFEEETKHVPQPEEGCTEATTVSFKGHPDVIDDEILDLWIETAMSKDTGELKEDWSEPGLQTDTTSYQIKEEPGEILLEEMKSHSSVSFTQGFLSTQEPGFIDQSISETQPLEPPNTESLEGIHDMLATTSEATDLSEFSRPSSESQNVWMEETAGDEELFLREDEPVGMTEFCCDSGVSSPEEKPQSEESERSQEKPEEQSTETKAETEEGVTVCRDTLIELVEETMLDFSGEIKLPESGEHRADIESEEGIALTEPLVGGEHWTESEKHQLLLNASDHRWSEDLKVSPGVSRAEVAEEQTSSEDQNEVDAPVLDFKIQRSRIAVKNPRVRPPTDPRSLIHMPSADPTPSSHVPVKLPAGVPLGGLGIGIKLPALGAGFPVLKKTRPMGAEDSPVQSQEPAKKEEEMSNEAKQDEAQHKPKWKPPGHPGFGNPLMSELKTKLKKTPKE